MNADAHIFGTASDLLGRQGSDATEGFTGPTEWGEGDARIGVLLRHAWDVVSVFDRDLVRRYISPASTRILGYRPEELIGRYIGEIDHPDDAERTRAWFAELAGRPGGANTREVRILHRDGSYRWLEVVVANCLDDPDIAGFVATGRDITERKRVEEELRASEERLRLALDAARMGSWDWNIRDGTLTWSAQVEALHGLAPGTFDGTYGGFMATIHPDDRDALGEKVRMAVENQTDYEAEFRTLWSDGHVRWLLAKGQVLADATGAAVRLLGVTMDITAAKEAEAFQARRSRDAALRADVSSALAESASLREMLQRCAEAIVRHLDAAFARIWTLSADGTLLELQASAGLYTHLDGSHSRVPVGRLKIGLIAQERRPHLTNAVQTDPRVNDKTWARREGMVAFAGYPLLVEDRLVGVAAMFARHPLSQDTLDALAPVADAIAQNIERKALEQRLVHQAYHDRLTGLPNRALFMDRLGNALRGAAGSPGDRSVLVVDVDRFKVIVDSLGHDLADRVLMAVGQRLAACLGPDDTIARLRSDNFAILLHPVQNPSDATAVADRLLVSLRTPIAIADGEMVVNVTIGIAVAEPGQVRPDELLRNADMAMSRAKRTGGATYAVFDPVVDGQAGGRLALEMGLRRAIEQGELELHYQPEVDLRTGAIAGVEALVRWNHPARGLILPEAFVPLAEEAGLIVPLGRWVLEAACRQAKAWSSGRSSPLVVAVNLSALHFRQPDLVDDVARSLRSADLSPDHLELEITEQLLLADEEVIQQTLNALKALGVRLVIDDFGVGYSSLSYLHRLPVDAIKIDRSFIAGLGQDEGSATIVRAIAALAHTLGLRVTAEGVETAEHLAPVRAAGCDRAQGFYFAPPLLPEALTPLLERAAPFRS